MRIDDRLIHGQVIVGWLPVLNVQFLLVANERVAGDPVRQDMMSLAVPSGTSLVFHDPHKVFPDKVSEETMVVVASPKDAWKCLQAGIAPKRLNIGGMHARDGKEELLEALHLDTEDREYFRKIMESGIIPEFQPTPQNDPVPLSDIL